MVTVYTDHWQIIELERLSRPDRFFQFEKKQEEQAETFSSEG